MTGSPFSARKTADVCTTEMERAWGKPTIDEQKYEAFFAAAVHSMAIAVLLRRCDARSPLRETHCVRGLECHQKAVE